MTAKPLPISGTYNFRELAGFRADGGVVRAGTLFRSDALAQLGDRGREQVSELGITRVIDLRGDDERAQAPDALPSGTALIPHPIFQSATEQLSPDLDIYKLTERIYLEHGDTLASALAIIAEGHDAPGSATLFHCTAGKDRTGAVAALALTAVGVDRDDVLNDYASSEANLRGPWLDAQAAVVRGYGIELTPELESLLASTPAGALENALTAVEREHGTVRDYLRSSGFSDANLERLHAALVE